MTTGAHIVEIAVGFKGKHEEPMGSNTGPFVEKCQHATFLAGTGWFWCAAFICYVAKEAGVPLAYNSASAHGLADHHASTKQTLASAMPGDVCDWNIGDGHTSILVSKQGTSVTTIDGNWADAVSQVDHPTSELRGIWRIPGVDNTPGPPKPTLPPFVVATAAAGGRKLLFRAQSKQRLINWLMHHVLFKIAPNGITISRAKPKPKPKHP